MERNPFSAKNQTLQDLTECIFRLRCGIICSYSNRTQSRML